MSPFVFRLERVLQLRSRTERERARALGDAMRDEQARKESLEEAAAILDRCVEQIAETAGSICTAGALTNMGLSVEAATSQVEAAELSHRAAVTTVETEQERFGEARRDRRVIERLREQRQADWKVERSRDEQRELDDLNLRRRDPGEETP